MQVVRSVKSSGERRREWRQLQCVRHVFAFRLRIPTHGVAFFESDFMIALRPRQGDIVRPLRLGIVEVLALVIDFVGCARVIFRRILSNIRCIFGHCLLRRRDIIGDRIRRLCIIATGQYGESGGPLDLSAKSNGTICLIS